MSLKNPDPDPLPFDQGLALLHRFEAAAKARRHADLECARVLALLDEHQAWRSVGCASPGELGERCSLSAPETRALLDLGRAMKITPLLETQVLEGRITVAAAASVAPVLADPGLLRPEDDWIGWAETEPTRTVRRRVRRRIEEVRQGGTSVVPVSLFVRGRCRDDFDRARAIASQKASRALTPGETFETVVDHYLDTFDVDRVEPGARRAPPTAMIGSRYVPMAVRREIYERQGRTCAVPLCEHTMFLELAHLVAHASGGDREADNLVLLCSLHHRFLDGGTIRMEGTASKPHFLDALGRDFAKRYEPGGSRCSRETSGASSASGAASPPGSSDAVDASGPVSSADPVRPDNPASPANSARASGPAGASKSSRSRPPHVETGGRERIPGSGDPPPSPSEPCCLPEAPRPPEPTCPPEGSP